MFNNIRQWATHETPSVSAENFSLDEKVSPTKAGMELTLRLMRHLTPLTALPRGTATLPGILCSVSFRIFSTIFPATLLGNPLKILLQRLWEVLRKLVQQFIWNSFSFFSGIISALSLTIDSATASRISSAIPLETSSANSLGIDFGNFYE